MSKIKIPTYPGPFYKIFGIVKTLSGTYVCPGWHPVPDGTTRDQIEMIHPEGWIPPKKEEPKKPGKDLFFDATSSKGDQTYKVTRIRGNWDCTCPAKSFRRGECKHIKKFKEETI